MGKEKPGFLTPKAIANRIKSKGMQKLRWYCQMCQKQCRDENGFKCHNMSESHQRLLLLFAENSKLFMNEFSSEFNRDYLNTLKTRFGTKRVHANIVYQEYISDRNHIHMNATQWFTLTDYVKWLGRKGICVVDETEKGWFVTLIDRNPETIARQAEVEKKRKLDLDDTQRQQIFVEKQIERAKKVDENKPIVQPTELNKANENEKIRICLKKSDNSRVSSVEKQELEIIEEDKNDEERSEEKKPKRDNWLYKDIIVKITTNKLGEKYYKKKAVVTDVIDKYTGVVRLLDTDAVIKIDQAHLETVLPAVGKQVLVVNGAYRGEIAILEDINQDEFCAKISIAAGPLKGRVVNGVQYEDICRLF